MGHPAGSPHTESPSWNPIQPRLLHLILLSPSPNINCLSPLSTECCKARSNLLKLKLAYGGYLYPEAPHRAQSLNFNPGTVCPLWLPKAACYWFVDTCGLSVFFQTSRAVQRSLAIIRHARQKKQQKQYCMYYNRFGKCNRGNSCPYIHDPDKVAVCTR